MKLPKTFRLTTGQTAFIPRDQAMATQLRVEHKRWNQLLLSWKDSKAVAIKP